MSDLAALPPDEFWVSSGQDAFGWNVETRSPADDPEPSAFSELSVVRALHAIRTSENAPLQLVNRVIALPRATDIPRRIDSTMRNDDRL